MRSSACVGAKWYIHAPPYPPPACACALRGTHQPAGRLPTCLVHRAHASPVRKCISHPKSLATFCPTPCCCTHPASDSCVQQANCAMQQAAAPWQSVQANRFSSSIASFYRNISAQPPSGCMKPIKWKVCGKDWSKRREAALSSTLGLLWPPRCLASRGKSAPHAARAVYLDLGSRNPEPEARNDQRHTVFARGLRDQVPGCVGFSRSCFRSGSSVGAPLSVAQGHTTEVQLLIA